MWGLWLAIGLIVGVIGGWMLCASFTMVQTIGQRQEIWHLTIAVWGLLNATEQYHDNGQKMVTVRRFAQDALKKESGT